MEKEVYLICGVSGSGKTWVCNQLSGKFTYVPHDEHIADGKLIEALKASSSNGPFITECPFAERILRSDLEAAGFKVKPYFVYEPTDVIKTRFYNREGKFPSKSVMTRSVSIKTRIDEWNVPHGTSAELLEMLKTEVI